MQSGQSHLISRCLTLVVQSVGTVELQKVHLNSRAARRLQPGQVLAPAGRRTSAPSAGARARGRGELALAGVVLTSQRRQPAPAAVAGLAPAHIQVKPAAGSFTPTALMCVSPSPASMIPALLYAVRTAPFEALTAPGNLLQGKIKNQT